MIDFSSPRISIITPSYNQGQYLEDTILSVLGQNYPNLEYIIMDGGSDDNSIQIIKKYEDQLAFWKSAKDGGQAVAINEGFEKATGEVLMWLNSDDLLMPNVLKFIAAKYKIYGDAIYFGNCIHYKEEENGHLSTYGSYVSESHKSVNLALTDYIVQPSSFWSKSVFSKVGKLNDKLHYTFDWEWFLRAREKGFDFIPFDKTISIYRIHAGHKSGTGGSRRDEEILKVYQHFMPKYGNLFNLLICEKCLNSKWIETATKLIKLFFKNSNKFHVLKVLKYFKYKSYSNKLMNGVYKMKHF